MKLLQRLFCRLAVIVTATALLAGCSNQAQQNFTRPPAPVIVSTAVSQDVSNYMDALGKIVARETVSIQPQVSGRITQIHFTDGANVRKGQLLFTIDPRPFDANLKQAQANLARDTAAKKQAEANLAREIAREKWGLAQVGRYRTLVEQGVVPKEQYEQLRADYDSLKANSEAARAAVRSADETIKVDQAAIDTAKVQLSYCYIHSPIDGRAGHRQRSQSRRRRRQPRLQRRPEQCAAGHRTSGSDLRRLHDLAKQPERGPGSDACRHSPG
jgi:multidrug efflux system membrane fusion protein